MPVIDYGYEIHWLRWAELVDRLGDAEAATAAAQELPTVIDPVTKDKLYAYIWRWADND